MGVTGITEANCFAQNILVALVIAGTGVLVLGWESRTAVCTEWPRQWQTRTRLLGGKHSDPSRASMDNIIHVLYIIII